MEVDREQLESLRRDFEILDFKARYIADYTAHALSQVDGILSNEPKPQHDDRKQQADSLERDFDLLRAMGPCRGPRKPALSAYKRLSQRDRIALHVRMEQQGPAWRQMDKQFVPHLSTYINQRRWEDPMEVPTTKEETETLF